jgi:hypothetical protein
MVPSGRMQKRALITRGKLSLIWPKYQQRTCGDGRHDLRLSAMHRRSAYCTQPPNYPHLPGRYDTGEKVAEDTMKRFQYNYVSAWVRA